ncbi:phosphopantetheine-binding protein [Flavobacteriales bacterium]|nr:phosphopantetheine-binding protein [Flavobacteriales bacterium]
MDATELKVKLKEQIIEYLNLLDFTPEDIDDEDQLFGPKFDLDSIDALELSVLLEREYGIKIEDPAEGRKVLVTVNTMAEYILANKKEA